MRPKFFYRHATLKYLNEKLKDEPPHNVTLSKSKSSFNKMAKDLNIDPKTLKEYHHGFHLSPKGENHVECTTEGGEYMIAIKEPGVQAFHDEYWLSQGHKELNERIYDKTKWILPVAAIIISVLSVLITKCQGPKEVKLQKLQQRLDSVEAKVLRLSYNNIHPTEESDNTF